jgi:hypothetical protein
MMMVWSAADRNIYARMKLLIWIFQWHNETNVRPYTNCNRRKDVLQLLLYLREALILLGRRRVASFGLDIAAVVMGLLVRVCALWDQSSPCIYGMR